MFPSFTPFQREPQDGKLNFPFSFFFQVYSSFLSPIRFFVSPGIDAHLLLFFLTSIFFFSYSTLVFSSFGVGGIYDDKHAPGWVIIFDYTFSPHRYCLSRHIPSRAELNLLLSPKCASVAIHSLHPPNTRLTYLLFPFLPFFSVWYPRPGLTPIFVILVIRILRSFIKSLRCGQRVPGRSVLYFLFLYTCGLAVCLPVTWVFLFCIVCFFNSPSSFRLSSELSYISYMPTQ